MNETPYSEASDCRAGLDQYRDERIEALELRIGDMAEQIKDKTQTGTYEKLEALEARLESLIRALVERGSLHQFENGSLS